MSDHIGIRFKGVIKIEHRKFFDLIHPFTFNKGISYMPENWKPIFKYDVMSGNLEFIFSSSDWDYIKSMVKCLGAYLESCESCEFYHEYDDYSKLYLLVGNELKMVNDEFIRYTEERCTCGWHPCAKCLAEMEEEIK